MSSITLKTEDANYFMGISDKIIRVIEFASSLFYDANDKMTTDSWEKYIGARVKSGHESVTEHGLITFIIDTSQGHIRNDFLNNEIGCIEESIASSNTLLHYVKEDKWNPNAMEYPIIIISGNLKMWRDFIKYLFKTVFANVSGSGFMLKNIINMFLIFDNRCNGIFTKDIKELKFANKTVESLFLVNKDNVTVNFSRTWDEMPLLDKENMDLIYRQRPIPCNEYGEPENVDDNFDSGVEYYCASCDNFIREFILSSNITVPDYLVAFIQYHTMDINSISIYIKMPRIVTQQESRHRINSISQRSQRYVDESEKDISYYTPPTIDKNKVYSISSDGVPTLQLTYDQMNILIKNFYKALREDDIPKEDARCILNNGIYSFMMVTKPFHTLPHYFKERCSNAAQKEIREPAIALRKYLNDKFNFVVPKGTQLFE